MICDNLGRREPLPARPVAPDTLRPLRTRRARGASAARTRGDLEPAADPAVVEAHAVAVRMDVIDSPSRKPTQRGRLENDKACCTSPAWTLSIDGASVDTSS